jgi:hypothetical protein
MSGITAPYGRLGTQAGGDPRVTELLKRSVDGQYGAMSLFEATLASLKSRELVLWTAPVAELTFLNVQWLSLVAWEQATAFLDALVLTDSEFSDSSNRQTDQLCDSAAALSVRAIGMQTEISQGRRPGNTKLTPYLATPGNAANVTAVWSAIEAVYDRVTADLTTVKQAGIPPRMQKVYRQLWDSFEPKAKVFAYLQSQWRATADAQNRIQLVRQAVPLAEVFFGVGQQLWTPYLAGPAYVNIIRNQPLFAQLNLPFDPWILTDPAQVDQRVTDQQSCRQLIDFWSTVANPLAVKPLQEQINEALDAGQLTVQTARTFKIAPWHPHYAVNQDVVIGSQSIPAGKTFTFYPRTVEGKRILEIRVAG